VNWALAVSCVALVLAFGESSRLAAAYGIAVTGTMGITSIGFYQVARTRWNWSVAVAAPLTAAFLAVDLAFLGSNAIKFLDGGFVPIAVALFIFMIMRTWKRGRALLGRYFARASRPLNEFLSGLKRQVYVDRDGTEIAIVRVPGVAVFMTSNSQGTPPLLMHQIRRVKSLQETVILATVAIDRVPRVQGERFEFRKLSQGFLRLRIHVGFMESPNMPEALEAAMAHYELPFDAEDVTYFLGRETVLATTGGEMGPREETLFAFLTRNSQNATRYFGIPPERVVEIGMQIDLWASPPPERVLHPSDSD
jgi:KUP system potassium uptake protein